MKNLKFLFFAIITLAMSIIIFSCDDKDDDNSIKFFNLDSSPKAVSEIEIGIGFTNDVAIVSVSGKGGPYKGISSNQDVIETSTIRIEEPGYGVSETYRLYLKPKNSGEAVITVTDSNGEAGNLKVKVTANTEKWNVGEESIVIKDVDTALEAKIATDIKSKNMIEGNSFVFIYDATNSGKLKVYSDLYAKNLLYEGTFSLANRESSSASYYYIFNFNGREHRYLIGLSDANMQKSTELKMRLTEDLTEEYKQQYPDNNITEVKYSFIVRTLR